jgi:hypothetical protein
LEAERRREKGIRGVYLMFTEVVIGEEGTTTKDEDNASIFTAALL